MASTFEKNGIHVVSTDEKPAIQALEVMGGIKPARPGRVERREFNYIRHGTLCLIANLSVATGKIIAPSIGPTRKNQDFVNHIEQTVQSDPNAQWIFIVDQLNTHKSADLVQWVAEKCHIDTDLGKKGKTGILKSMSTRADFLADPTHQISFLYTPKHSSWLNQIEIWFSILTRRLLKRSSFKSIDHLKHKILNFIEYFNATMAKAFKWNYHGLPVEG